MMMVKLRVRLCLGEAAGEVEGVAVAAQKVAGVAAEKAAAVEAVKVKARVAVPAAVEARVAAVPESARLLEEVRVQPSYLGKVVEDRSL